MDVKQWNAQLREAFDKHLRTNKLRGQQCAAETGLSVSTVSAFRNGQDFSEKTLRKIEAWMLGGSPGASESSTERVLTVLANELDRTAGMLRNGMLPVEMRFESFCTFITTNNASLDHFRAQLSGKNHKQKI